MRIAVICPPDDRVARRVLHDYGALFVASDKVALPSVCVFSDEEQVSRFQAAAGCAAPERIVPWTFTLDVPLSTIAFNEIGIDVVIRIKDRDSGPFNDSPDAGVKGNQVFKFDQNGKLLLTLGKAGVGKADTDTFLQPAACRG